MSIFIRRESEREKPKRLTLKLSHFYLSISHFWWIKCISAFYMYTGTAVWLTDVEIIIWHLKMCSFTSTSLPKIQCDVCCFCLMCGTLFTLLKRKREKKEQPESRERKFPYLWLKSFRLSANDLRVKNNGKIGIAWNFVICSVMRFFCVFHF